MNSFEYLGDLFFGSDYFSFHYDDATTEELQQLMDFGFTLTIRGGIVELDKNKTAMARVILEDIWLEDEVSDVVEYRFLDSKHAELEIETVYLQDETKTIDQVRADILTDWKLNEKESEQKKKDDAEYFDEKRHPDDKAHAGQRLLPDDYELDN